MAKLQCRANTCMYNMDEYCSRGDITVGGKHATMGNDTSCESFSERREDRFTSSTVHPSQYISVDCEAVNCIHNNDYKCVASQVEIKGMGASNRVETNCGTFQERV